MDISNPTVIAGMIVLALQAAVAFFLKQIANKFDKMVDKVNDHAVELGSLKQQVADLKGEVKEVRERNHDLRNWISEKLTNG